MKPLLSALESVFTCLVSLASKHPLISHQAGSAVALSVHGECYRGGHCTDLRRWFG